MIDPLRIPIVSRCQGYYLRWYYNGWHYWQFFTGALSYKTEGEKYRTYGTRYITVSSGQVTAAQAEAIRTILNTTEVYLYTDYGWSNVRVEAGQAEVYNNQTKACEVVIKMAIGSRMLNVTGYSPVADIPVVEPSQTFCRVAMGTQIWMCKNWDATYPGSKVYNNDEANRAIYGGLYNGNQIKNAGFCPSGWHIPSYDEWMTLFNYLGGISVGGRIKQSGTTYWNSPNTGADAALSFNLRGAGYGYLSGGTMYFINQLVRAQLWTATDVFPSVMFDYSDSQAFLTSAARATTYLSVRMISDQGSTAYDDWFLPSISELDLMYDNLKAHGVGGFYTERYWSSSEYSATHAKTVGFDAGGIANHIKTSTYRVRASRTFTDEVGAYSLRDTGPAGGLIYYINGTTYYEAAPYDQAESQAWSNIVNTAVGTTSTAIGSGQANTLAIISQVGHTGSPAKICDDLIVYGL